MRNRKYFVALFLAVAFILIPAFSRAQTPTIAELQAQIAALQRQLAILLGQQDNTGTWCHTFNTNLSIGMSGSEVIALHRALGLAGFASGEDVVHEEFSEGTASAVSGFQEKYRSEILTPLGLANPTGYFGPATRVVMNRLYGCGNKDREDRTTGQIRVLSPNGGEVLVKEQTYRIEWGLGTESTRGSVNIYLVHEDSGRWAIGSLISGTYYDWKVGNAPRADGVVPSRSGFFIEICDGVRCDRSDSSFRIVDSESQDTPSLTVTSPNSGAYQVGSSLGDVTWTSSNIPSGTLVNLGVMNSTNTANASYLANTANDGIQRLSLRSDALAGQYRVRITALVDGQLITAYGGWISVTSLTAPAAYTLTTATTGVLGAGSGTITKSPNQTSYAAGTVVTLTANPATGSTFVGWSGNLTHLVSPATITMNGDKSVTAIFAAATTPPATPSLTVASPSSNQQWTATNGPVIQWSSANIPSGNTITVELLTPSNGQVLGWSNFSTANDGSESGRLTNSSVASGWYYFRLKTIVNSQTIYGGSGVFQFTGASAPPPPTCGNGILDSGEQCDGSNFGGLSCSSYNYTAGNLSCSSSCFLSTSQCTNPPPPAPASISISSPTASSRWTPTAFTHSVTWTSSNIPSSQYLTMELMTPTNTRVNAFTPVSSVNDGSQAVNISNIVPGYYWFRLTATVNGQTVYGGSPVFQIVSN